jgi:hypothetical protein
MGIIPESIKFRVSPVNVVSVKLTKNRAGSAK